MLEGQIVLVEFGKGGHACTSIWIIFALQSHFAVRLLIDQTYGNLADVQNHYL